MELTTDYSIVIFVKDQPVINVPTWVNCVKYVTVIYVRNVGYIQDVLSVIRRSVVYAS